MPDWAIVLFAAFGGGLAGAVLQPLVGLGADILLADRNVRKRRERTLRRMLVAEMRLGRSAIAATFSMKARLELGTPLSSKELLDILTPAERRSLWEPERISDPQLKATAEHYDRTRAQLSGLLWENAPDLDEAFALSRQLESLQPTITLRMDKLKWPEEDD